MNRPSIRQNLLVRLLITVLLTVSAASGLVYLYSKKEVNALSDANLVQQATVLGLLLNHEAGEEIKRAHEISRLQVELGSDARTRSPLFSKMVRDSQHTAEHRDYLDMAPLTRRQNHRYQTHVSFFVRYPSGQIMIRTPGMAFFEVFEDGFGTFMRNGKGWRVYTLTMPDTHLLVQLSQRTDERQAPISAMLNRALWPLLLMMPVLGLIIWRGVGKGLVQLHSLARRLEHRDPHSLELISTRGMAKELIPMVGALNQLFARVDAAMENEHQFTSDAAHELRNPLAVLKTRVQVFELTAETDQQHDFVRDMLSGIDRITRLLAQLLMLARADVRKREGSYSVLNILPLCEKTLAAYGEQALDRNIKLCLEGIDIQIHGDYTALSILLGNLVENAIRYIPDGGHIRVGTRKLKDAVELLIEDDGPGIPPESREAFFQRFRRGAHSDAAGSGLGLSIVRQIAELHHAKVLLETPSSGRGLLVRVVFGHRPRSAR